MSTQAVPQPDSGQLQHKKLPDGSYGKFAANATDDVIKSAISKDFPDAFATPTQQAANRFVDPGNTSMSAGTHTSDQAHPKPQPGALQRFTQGTEIPTSQSDTTEAVRGVLTPQADPNETDSTARFVDEVPILGGDFRARAALSKRADQEGGSGVGVAHRIASHIPLVGPAVTAAQDKYDQGDYAGAFGAGLNALFSMEGMRSGITPKVPDVPVKSLGTETSEAAARPPLTPPKPVTPLRTTLANAVDKGTDVLANTLIDPRKTFTETIPRAAGRAVKRSLGQPPTQTASPVRPQLALPAAPIELPAVPTAPELEGLLPAASTVVYDPVTGQSRVQFLTSAAEPGHGFTPQDSQLLNDPRGAFARYAQDQDLGGLADPLAANNPNPITNPIKPKSTLPAWASEVTDWERNDPQHLFNQIDEHDFLNYQRQEQILQWMEEHNKQPEPFQSKGLKTSDTAKQP